MSAYRSTIIWFVILAAGLGLAHLLDKRVFAPTDDWHIHSMGVAAMCRVWGYFPSWLVIAIAVLLIDRKRFAGRPVRVVTRRAELLFWSPLLAGIVAEGLKLVLRRERPTLHGGERVFRDYSENFFHGGGLGLPSSDAAVAWAGALILVRLYPAAAPVWLLGATACGIARLQDGAHFLSDVFVGGIVGGLVAMLVWRLSGRTMRKVAELEAAATS